MGSSVLKIKEQTLKHRKNIFISKWLFTSMNNLPSPWNIFILEFFNLLSISRPRHWNLLEKLFDEEETGFQSNQTCCSRKSVEKSSDSTTKESKTDVEVEKTNQENKSLEPVTQSVSKRFMSKVSCQETMEKVEIKIQFGGHKFMA